MSALSAGGGVDAASLALEHEPLPSSDVVAGAPTAASIAVSQLGDVEIGVWEMTPGTVTDIEADEVFVVLSGRALVRFLSPQLPDLEIGPGSIVRLDAGMQTEWTVTETLRKVYVA